MTTNNLIKIDLIELDTNLIVLYSITKDQQTEKFVNFEHKISILIIWVHMDEARFSKQISRHTNTTLHTRQ